MSSTVHELFVTFTKLSDRIAAHGHSGQFTSYIVEASDPEGDVTLTIHLYGGTPPRIGDRIKIAVEHA